MPPCLSAQAADRRRSDAVRRRWPGSNGRRRHPPEAARVCRTQRWSPLTRGPRADLGASAADVEPVSRHHGISAWSRRGPTLRAYCVASTSVGAIMAAWVPLSAAAASACAATTVLPVPTSPSRSRFMGCGARMSARMSADCRVLLGGEREWDDAVDVGQIGAVGLVGESRTLVDGCVPPHRERTLGEESLVVLEPVHGGGQLFSRVREAGCRGGPLAGTRVPVRGAESSGSGSGTSP